MKRVFTTENTITRVLSKYDHARGREHERYLLRPEEHLQARALNSAKLANDLRFLQREGDPAASQMDYIYNLVEYPSRIKKLFIKGNSKKEVPRQVLNIVTNSFQTRPKVFLVVMMWNLRNLRMPLLVHILHLHPALYGRKWNKRHRLHKKGTKL